MRETRVVVQNMAIR